MTGLFSQPQSSGSTAPSPKAPAPMPDSSSPAVLEARRRAQQDILNRAGRQSTILTAPKDRVGDTYSANTLGSGN